jgi:hypoxanthine-guanine phosphoribosyltransferase
MPTGKISASLTLLQRTVGGKVTDFPNIETARKVSVDYTLAAAQAFATNLAPRLAEAERKFSFVFCSGYGAEQKKDARVWLYADSRKLKVSWRDVGR